MICFPIVLYRYRHLPGRHYSESATTGFLDCIDIVYDHVTILCPYVSKLFAECNVKSVEKNISWNNLAN
jgi:hypothetical protein